MKKTVTTILSLALALILVSSLSSGVILAKGDDDHDNRKKNKNKYVTVSFFDVAILDCFATGGTMIVVAFDFVATEGGDVSGIVPGDTCAFALASLQSTGFKAQSNYFLGGDFDPKSRHTLVRKRKVRVEK